MTRDGGTASTLDDFVRYCCGKPECDNDCEREKCACGYPLVACSKCGDSRCLHCDPYDEADICGN